MNNLLKLSVLGTVAVLSSCNVLNKISKPLSDSDYNPLDKLGTRYKNKSVSESLVNTNGYGFNNGDIVEVVIPNTALFAKVPKPGERYKKVLKVGDTLRVLGGEKDFIKVLTKSGETGFVSSVMVVSQGFLNDPSPIDPNVTAVGADETPIIPDIAPDPEIDGIGVPDPSPVVIPSPIPEIVPPIPDPKPVVPSLPDLPAPEPEVPGLKE